MNRKLVPDWRQKDKVAALVDDLGVKVYREVKASLKIGRMKPFQRLTYAEAVQIIGMMESLKIEQFEMQREQAFDSHRQQTHPSHTVSLGLLEQPSPLAAGERSE